VQSAFIQIEMDLGTTEVGLLACYLEFVMYLFKF